MSDAVPNRALIERSVVNAAIAETFVKLLAIEYLLERTIGREAGRQVKFIGRQSLEGFGAEDSSLTEIARLLLGYRAAIKIELENSKLEPIFEPEGFIARFYVRSDLAHAILEL